MAKKYGKLRFFITAEDEAQRDLIVKELTKEDVEELLECDPGDVHKFTVSPAKSKYVLWCTAEGEFDESLCNRAMIVLS